MYSGLVSIVVPVYNVEKFIEKCVNSLIGQTYPNIEIILVDDGSTDSSLKIIQNIEKNDARIRVFHKENSGVSATRNLGIDMSRGEYLLFVDGDDWVEPEYVDYFLSLVLKTKSKIGFNKNNFYIGETKSEDVIYTVDSMKAIEWIYSDEIFVAVWNKIYSAELIKKNNIKFSEDIWYGEGMLFNIQCLQFADKVAITERSVYHQTFNPDSAMRNFRLRSNYCGISSLWLQRSLWRKENADILNAWEFHRYRFNRTIIDGLVRTNQVAENYGAYKECISNIRHGIRCALKNEKGVKKKMGWLAYCFVPRIMGKRASSKLDKLLKTSGGGIKQRYKILDQFAYSNRKWGVCA